MIASKSKSYCFHYILHGICLIQLFIIFNLMKQNYKSIVYDCNKQIKNPQVFEEYSIYKKNSSFLEKNTNFSQDQQYDYETLQAEKKKLEEEVYKLKFDYQKLIEQSKFLKEPTLIYEKKRRRIYKTIMNMWEYSKYQINTLKSENSSASKTLTEFYSTLYEYKLSLVDDWMRMSESDGYDEWRQMERADLDKIIQKRFSHLQNPLDCNKSEILYCSFPYWSGDCGWGCGVHKFVDCFAIAYGLRRTLIYDATPFIYSKHDDVYEPISKNCLTFIGADSKDWPDESARIIKMDKFHSPFDQKPRSKYLPSAIPSDLAHRMEKLFENLIAYWMYQIKQFYLKHKKEFQELISKSVSRIIFSGPIVGVHVRRTDKIRENAYSDVEKYMTHAEEFFDQINITQTIDKRKIYVATDSMDVIEELKQKYPHYDIFYNEDSIKSANKTHRFSKESLIGLMADIESLLKCDYFVGTYSSAYGRTVADLMFSKYLDASMRAVSVDYLYQILTDKHQLHKVVFAHTHSSGTSFKVNQTISLDYKFNENGLVRVNYENKLYDIPAFTVERFQDIQDFKTDDSIYA